MICHFEKVLERKSGITASILCIMVSKNTVIFFSKFWNFGFDFVVD